MKFLQALGASFDHSSTSMGPTARLEDDLAFGRGLRVVDARHVELWCVAAMAFRAAPRGARLAVQRGGVEAVAARAAAQRW